MGIPGLVVDPFVQKYELDDNVEFIVLACDGVWDYVSQKDVIKSCRREFRKHDDPRKVADMLVNQAAKNPNPSMDNMTAIVVGFGALDKSGDRCVVKRQVRVRRSRFAKRTVPPEQRAVFLCVPV